MENIDERPKFPLANLIELPDGRLVQWEAIGDGESLLWIEGGPGLPAHLARPEVHMFAGRFRGHLVNAPGCGRSSPPASADGYGLDPTVRYFDEARQAIGLDAVTVMAHSWGGLVALGLALAVPQAVRRLIIIDGYAGLASVPERDANAERDRALDRVRGEPWFDKAVSAFVRELGTSRELDDRFGSCWPLYFAEPGSARSKSHIERLTRELRWNIDAAKAWDPEPEVNFLPQLAAIGCPTLVVAGEHDFICGPAWNRPIAAAIPGAVYVEFPGVGHLPQYEAGDAFRRVVFEWLAAQPA
jgi:pimeloyl-ACP methyl ester carboxylesterase